MPEFYLRHTVYTKIVSPSAINAAETSGEIRGEVIEQLQNIGVEVIEYDEQKVWELVAQQKAGM